MDKLNYDILQTLVSGVGHGLEVTNVDVKRLRDDRSEIGVGEEVAFVATASFRLTQGGVTQLTDYSGSGHLAVGDELLVIGSDAELRSETLEIDEDSVALWLAEHYTFTFLLNGVHHHQAFRDVGRVRVTTEHPKDHALKLALPWLKKLNTAAVKDDYIDVDVKIVENSATPMVPPKTSVLLSANQGKLAFKEASLAFELEVDAAPGASYKSAESLVGRRFRLPLTSEHGDVELWITVNNVTPRAKTTDTAAMTKATKHRP